VITIQVTKDFNKTVLYARATAQKRREAVVIVSDNRPVLSINEHGDISEVLAKPLKVSFRDLIADAMVGRGPRVQTATLALARWIQNKRDAATAAKRKVA
jgi:hypothetical protein